MKRRIPLLIVIGFLVGRENQYIFDLEITGNQQLETSQLKNKIRLKSRSLFSKTKFNQKKLHLDEITLKNFYQTIYFLLHKNVLSIYEWMSSVSPLRHLFEKSLLEEKVFL